MGLRSEKVYPLVIASVGAAVAWWYSFALPPGGEKEFLAAALSLGAVLTGFIATAQAILMALPSDSVMGRIRSSGYLNELVSYISQALVGGLLFCFISLLGFYVLDAEADFKRLFAGTWMWSSLFCGVTFYRVTTIMMRIMRH
jgi:hypothetical protein